MPQPARRGLRRVKATPAVTDKEGNGERPIA